MDVLMVEQPLLLMLNQLLSVPDEMERLLNAPTRSSVRDTKAMVSTPADVEEYSSYVFVLDMPGLKSGESKVQIKEGNVLSISGERKREEQQQHKEKEEEAEVKYLRMERRVGKFMRKFNIPKNANANAISVVYQDGVLTVTVQKLPPPEPKKPRLSRSRWLEKQSPSVVLAQMERWVRKFTRKFNLPKNVNTDAISAEHQDGVLTVTVQKVPPLEPKKPKIIEVKVA